MKMRLMIKTLVTVKITI